MNPRERGPTDSDPHYRLMFENNPQPMWVYDARNLSILAANHATVQQYGYSLEELLGMTICDLRPAEEMPRLLEDVGKANTDLHTDGPWRHKKKDGTMIWVEVTTHPIQFSGHDARFVMASDITGRQRVMEQLRRSEAHFRFLADSMPDIVWTANADGQFEYLNQRWYEFTGGIISKRHLMESLQQAIHPEDLERFVSQWQSAVAEGNAFEAECRFADNRAGGYRWFLCRGTPVSDEGTAAARWFGTFSDVDNQKRIEASLRRANEDLHRFAYSAHHDLQEPLRRVSMYSQLLRKQYAGQLAGEAEEFIQFIVRDTNRMRALLDDLARYTETGVAAQQPLPSSDANIAVQRALLNLDRAITESHAVFDVGELPSVRTTEEQLQQLFQKLIENAIQYRQAGSKPNIQITARREGAEWIFSVRDNAIGIAPQDLPYLFGIFKRLHGPGQYGSTGMGLAVCQKIVEQYGGRIWVESQSGVGSAFHFSLPVRAVDMIPLNQP